MKRFISHRIFTANQHKEEVRIRARPPRGSYTTRYLTPDTMTAIKVTKTTGEQEPFNETKLRRSLARAGADQQIIEQIVKSIRNKLYNGIST